MGGHVSVTFDYFTKFNNNKNILINIKIYIDKKDSTLYYMYIRLVRYRNKYTYCTKREKFLC